MIKAGLDSNNYYTGNYANTGNVKNGIKVNSLPPYSEIEKQMSCKYINGNWIYDENRYQEILQQKSIEERQAQISILKEQLNQTDYKIIKCSEYQLAGIDMPYDVVVLHQERQALREQINELENNDNV